MFKTVLFHPDESQLLTTGSDRQITYWDMYDGTDIRKLEGSSEGGVNALAITQDGEWFVSGGEDTIVKFWNYDDGTVNYLGRGHSSEITKIQISPDQASIVSIGLEGAIYIWRMPEDILKVKEDMELPEPAVP